MPTPKWINPTDGLAWTYATTKGAIRPEWKGMADCPYVIEYELGTGDYHLVSQVEVKGNFLDFGSFSENYWNTCLVPRNPFKLRVSPDKTPRDWSDWAAFKFEP